MGSSALFDVAGFAGSRSAVHSLEWQASLATRGEGGESARGVPTAGAAAEGGARTAATREVEASLDDEVAQALQNRRVAADERVVEVDGGALAGAELAEKGEEIIATRMLNPRRTARRARARRPEVRSGEAASVKRPPSCDANAMPGC